MSTNAPIADEADLARDAFPKAGPSKRPDDRMSTAPVEYRIGGQASRHACRRKLQSLGVNERQAAQMAADEFADSRPDPVRRVVAGDQRVFPQGDGWLVTRDFNAGAAHHFLLRMDAERYARRAARNGGGTGILFYDQAGCAEVYVDYPSWRREKRPRSPAPSLER